MNTKDCNPHVGVDISRDDKSIASFGSIDEDGVAYVDGVLIIDDVTEEEYKQLVANWNAFMDTRDCLDRLADIVNETHKLRRYKIMKKLRIIAIVWLCIGIPALIASLAYFIWLTTPR